MINRPLALVILDGWGYAPRTDGNAVAVANTPHYDEICRKYPMTTLSASGPVIGDQAATAGGPELGHLNIGTGRLARTEAVQIKNAVVSGEFMDNAVLNRAFDQVKSDGKAIHLIGLVSDGGVHSNIENLFALLRLAKNKDISEVYIHCILDGLDVPERTADIYIEALEIKLADIGIGRIATMCGRFFAMDSSEHWERTARVFTLLVHAEGERCDDAVTAVRNSFLRGISDEFIAPIVIESSLDVPVTTVKSGDLVVFFNHRADTMRQLVRSLCIPDAEGSAKPEISTVCLAEYDRSFGLPVAFAHEPEKNTLAEILSANAISTIKITETARRAHLTEFFDGATDRHWESEHEIILSPHNPLGEVRPESLSFKIADKVRRGIEAQPGSVFVVNLPAAGLMAETGDLNRTVAAIQYVDTCIGGICEKVQEYGGTVLLTSTHGNCEDMVIAETGEPNPVPTANPVPFHLVSESSRGTSLRHGCSLEDVAPTLLGILNIEKPPEMTGSDIRSL